MKRAYMDGILYALLFAVPAYILGLYFPIVGGPVFGILLGIVQQLGHLFSTQLALLIFHNTFVYHCSGFKSNTHKNAVSAKIERKRQRFFVFFNDFHPVSMPEKA